MATYTAVAVSRTPAQLTGPTLVELGPLHGTISYTDSLKDTGTATITVDVDSLDETIKTRLRDPLNLPLEIWIYRDSTIVAGGPFIGGSIDGTQLTIDIAGLEAYTEFMLITANKAWTLTDLSVIAAEVIDDWQDLSYGDFGINTATVGLSGVPRTAAFPGATEPITVYEFLAEHAGTGFDWWVDPDTRELRVEATRGLDLSDSVFLELGVTSSSIRFAVAPGLVCSEVYAHATTATEGASTRTSIVTNPTTRNAFGRSGIPLALDSVESAQHTEAIANTHLDERSTAFLVPGPGLVPVQGAGVEDFGVGDTVTYTFDAGLGQMTGAYRIIKRKVSVGDDGQETMTLEFDEA